MTEPTWKRSVPREQPWGGCRVCQHFRPGWTCTAFPDRIPLVIASGEVDHRVVRPGQVGNDVWELNDAPQGLAARLIEAARKRGEAWAIEPVPATSER